MRVLMMMLIIRAMMARVMMVAASEWRPGASPGPTKFKWGRISLHQMKMSNMQNTQRSVKINLPIQPMEMRLL